MPVSRLKIVLWLLAYLGVVLLPLAFAMLISRPPPRDLFVETGAILGLLALGVLAGQLVISGRHRWFAGGVGQDNLLQFHRRMGVFGWLLILAHPILLILGDRAFFAWIDPREDVLRAVTVIGLMLAVTTLLVTSLWRVSLGLSYEAWRTVHAILALLVVAGGLAHALLGSHHTAGRATQLLLTGAVGLPLVLLLETRLWRPWRLRRRPWRIVDIEKLRDESVRLMLHADGHCGLTFRAGQYAWLTIGDTPFTLQQHPFSMASSPGDPDTLEFIVKQTGDFTRSLSHVASGTRAFIEGPYGVFAIDVNANRRAVFIAGGIGITPVLSMLRACREHGHSQPVWLLYGNENENGVIAREVLDRLAESLPLTVVHVLTEPADDWDGARGYIDAELLEQVLPADADDIDYFVCGPEPLMDKVEPALKARGVDALRVYAERFDLV